MKICKICKKLLTEDCFFFYDRGKKKLRSICKSCSAQKVRNMYNNNEAFRTEKCRQNNNWRIAHEQQFKNSKKKTYLKYRGKCLAQNHFYYKENWASIRNSQKAWQREHRNEKNHYNMRSYHSNPVVKLRQIIGCRLRNVLLHNYIYKTFHTIKYLGCTAIQLKDYIASKFQSGMTWENHGKFGWHVDHIKPSASFDFNDPKQIEAAFHYTNLQPLWWFENLKKGSKVA